MGDLLANLITDAHIEGQENGFTTYVNAHHAIDRDNNPFAPGLEGYSEDIRENPYVRGFTIEAYKEGFELGQQTGEETFPEITVLRTEVANDLTTAELTEEEREQQKSALDVGQSLSSESGTAQQAWANDMDEWLRSGRATQIGSEDNLTSEATVDSALGSYDGDLKGPSDGGDSPRETTDGVDNTNEFNEENLLGEDVLAEDTEATLRKVHGEDGLQQGKAETNALLETGADDDLENDSSSAPEAETNEVGDRPSDYEDAFTSSNRPDIAEKAISDKSPDAREDIDESAVNPEPASNTIAALFQSIEQLPEDSPARELAEKIATDIQARESEVIAREERAQSLKNIAKTSLSSIKSFASNVREGAVEAIDAVRHPSPRGIAGLALKTVGVATRTSGRALKATGQYLQTRAEKLDEYGMAKAAVTIHKKGNARTGENSFSKDGYTVEKSGNQYKVLDSMNRSVMEFKTNSKGQPIRVIQTEAAQAQDKKALKKIARSPVILGSSEKEKVYERKVRAIIEVVEARLGDGQKWSGKNFEISKRNGDIEISTKTDPGRTAIIDRKDEVQSNLTREDVNYLSSQMAELEHRIYTHERQPVASQIAM
ncbi:hypothetical protein [cf. Phormidesmis sp. LEGE 11477]|uniref:hypothetical protein n=1 Tax=cf. Phormidesmis sp. LEGE 11477 TaxID=1828680 RepID=UPI001881B071|nr:hypothetical protein [cf. Phormidesmis sp. LEGE 11477]MBE9062881.1 hypothetical protein [cf. Phormidesmis sp. LEGE 11477]